MILFLKKFFAINVGGYAFSFDALLAIVVFSIFLVFLNFPSIESQTVAVEKHKMLKLSDDLLDELDKAQIFQTFDVNQISSTIDVVLPQQFSWKMKIESFNFKNGDFVKFKEYTFGNTEQDLSSKDFVKSRRLFLTFSNQQTDLYSNAELWLWKK